MSKFIIDESLDFIVAKVLKNNAIALQKSNQYLVPEPEFIRAGIHGGLPWDCQTSDVVIGCLPLEKICYGNCFAAEESTKKGIDFSARVKRILDPKLLCEDFEHISKDQKFVRNGWNSDPCWDWKTSIQVGEIARNHGKLIVYNSKLFIQPSEKHLKRLRSIGAEVRSSISALDKASVLKRKLEMIKSVQEHGINVVACVVSALYKSEVLQYNQNGVVDYLLSQGIPCSEMPLRFNRSCSVAELLDVNESFAIENTDKFWFGRLYSEKLIIPILSHTRANYSGLPLNIHKDFVDTITENYFPAIDDLRKGHSYSMGDKLGVGLIYKR
jgi:hypothetical protein